MTMTIIRLINGIWILDILLELMVLMIEEEQKRYMARTDKWINMSERECVCVCVCVCVCEIVICFEVSGMCAVLVQI